MSKLVSDGNNIHRKVRNQLEFARKFSAGFGCSVHYLYSPPKTGLLYSLKFLDTVLLAEKSKTTSCRATLERDLCPVISMLEPRAK